MMAIDWNSFFEDGLFAAMAAIGFSAISHTPRRAYFICALAAAVGHSLRFILMHSDIFCGNIILATAIAAFMVGIVAVIMSPMIKVPPETCLFPALLPMIPGMFAYRTIAAFVECVGAVSDAAVMKSIALLCTNGFTCIAIIICMTISANIPIFILKRISFQSTR